MGKGLQESFRVYLCRLRKAMQLEVLRQHSIPTPATTSRLLSACKYPRTASFAAERRHRDRAHDGGSGGAPAATLADVDRFLFENFNSLYATRDGDADGGGTPNEDYLVVGCSPPPRQAGGLPLDARASRCFFTSPGTSNSLLEEARPSAASTTSSSCSNSSSASSPSTATATRRPRPSDAGEAPPAIPGDSMAVVTFSKDPYADFRRSMEEMVEARHRNPREPLDWDFMEELLISYLQLNDRCVHQHILGAFTDLAVALRRRWTTPGGRGGIPPPPSAAAKWKRWERPAERGGLEEA